MSRATNVRDPVTWVALVGIGLIVAGLMTTFGTRRHPEWKDAWGTIGEPATIQVSVSFLVILAGAAVLLLSRWMRRRAGETDKAERP